MIVNKLTIEMYQEADNEIGSESLEITLNPALIGLFNKEKEINYYITLKSADGFSFEDSSEAISLFDKIKRIANECK